MRMEGYSLSDIAAATGNNGNNNGFGNGDGAWLIILFLILSVKLCQSIYLTLSKLVS